MSNEIGQLQADIENFINHLHANKIDGFITDRLAEVKDNLQNQNSEWFYLDLYSALNPTLLLEQARGAYRKGFQWIGFIEIIRNFLVLVPITLTWYALSQASTAYYHAITDNPSLITVPFLLQWEKGFSDGFPSWLSFSQVALMDAVIMIIIIAATILVHTYNNVRFERSEHNAIKLAAEFDNLLWRINKILVQRTSPEKISQTLLNDIGNFVGQFQQQGTDLQDLLLAEQERLQKLSEYRHQELKDFEAVTNDLLVGTGQLTGFADDICQNLQSFQQTALAMATETQQMTKGQDKLDRTLKALEGHLGSFEKVMNALTHTLDSKLTTMEHSIQFKLSELTSVSENMGVAALKIAQKQVDLHQDLVDEKQINTNISTQLTQVVNQIAALNNSFENASRKNDAMTTGFVNSYTETNQGLQILNGNLQQFSSLIVPANDYYRQTIDCLQDLTQKFEDTQLELSYTRDELTNAYKSYGVTIQVFQDSTNKNLKALTDMNSQMKVIASHYQADVETQKLVKELNTLNNLLSKRPGFIERIFGK